MAAVMQKPRSGLQMLLLAAMCAGFAARATATSVTVVLPSGAGYVLNVHLLEPAAGLAPQPYVAFSEFSAVLRQFDPQSQWDWDARTGLLRLAVADQRFSFPSARPFVAINDRLVQVAVPIRFAEGDIWMPLATFRLVVGSLEGLRLLEGDEHVAVRAPSTTAPIVFSPEQALGKGLLRDGSALGATDGFASAPMLAIPPPGAVPTWRVVLDPVLVNVSGAVEGDASSIRPALAQVAERCASILGEEGSMQPLLLTEHDVNTTAELILEWLSRQTPDLIVFLRLEISPLRASPGYMIIYSDESVDSLGLQEPFDTSSNAAIAPRGQSYLPFQVGSRQLAATIGSALAEVAGFRERLILPAPLYLLKRCPARSVMVIFVFPRGSNDVSRLADSGFRESLARALAGGLIAFHRERLALADQPSPAEVPGP